MRKEALIIFVRDPEIGKVKTRLAATLGKEAALRVYIKLLEHTHHISAEVTGDKYIFYAGATSGQDMWTGAGYFKLQQADGNLGQRMQHAFETVFGLGYTHVCIVGSDCYELSGQAICEAFALLDQTDVVLGPAHDGGYYLLGMKQLYVALFQDKSWSSASVFPETVQSIRQAGLKFEQLLWLHDVDEAENVPPAWLAEIKSSQL